MSDPKATPVTPKAANPANAPAAVQAADPVIRKRIPMSVPQRRLEVPKIPGFVCFWFKESNVPRAMQAGYEFVDSNELPLNQHNVATDKGISGNQDLGSRIKLVSGQSEFGDPQYCVLMKIREEFWNEDHAGVARKNAEALQSIFVNEAIQDGGQQLSAEDKALRYVKTALLQRPPRKARG